MNLSPHTRNYLSLITLLDDVALPNGLVINGSFSAIGEFSVSIEGGTLEVVLTCAEKDKFVVTIFEVSTARVFAIHDVPADANEDHLKDLRRKIVYYLRRGNTARGKPQMLQERDGDRH